MLDEESVTDRPGGAGLAALLAAGQGHDVALVTAIADDEAGSRLCELLTDAGIAVYPLPLPGATPEKVRLRADGQVLVRLGPRRRPGGPGRPSEAALAVLRDASAILVSDYGRGVARNARLRAALQQAKAPVVWDRTPTGRPRCPTCALVTPNEAEVRKLADDAGSGPMLSTVHRAGQQLRAALAGRRGRR
ncbi:hypothetical protein GCM10020358_33790 [Amorphoplanes nipponensis]